MKKLLATLLLSTLAFVPATSAWAGGGTSTSSGGPKVAVGWSESRGDSGSSDRQNYYGCYEGHMFVIVVRPDGTMFGSISNTVCEGPNWIAVL